MMDPWKIKRLCCILKLKQEKETSYKVNIRLIYKFIKDVFQVTPDNESAREN